MNPQPLRISVHALQRAREEMVFDLNVDHSVSVVRVDGRDVFFIILLLDYYFYLRRYTRVVLTSVIQCITFKFRQISSRTSSTRAGITLRALSAPTVRRALRQPGSQRV